MKGFKNSTRTQSGHGFDEVPTRPAMSKDVAAAKAVRIITPGKSTPRVTDSMILGKGEDKAPGERGGKKFAVGGMVPPVASGGMPAQGQPITAKNANDARVRPMPVAPKAPLIAPKYRPSSAGAQAYRARLEASKGVGKGPSYDLATGKPIDPDVGRLPAAAVTRSTGTPPAPARPTSAQMAALPTTKETLPTLTKMKPVGPYDGNAVKPVFKKGGKVVEKGSKEVYASKAAMKKHEASESKAKERSGHAGYAKGGKSRWC